MDGEQHRPRTPKHERKRKKKRAAGGKGGGPVDRAGRDGEGTGGGVVAQERSVPTGTDREQHGSGNLNTAPSRPQHHQTAVGPVKAAGNGNDPGAAGNSGSGGDGGQGVKKSKKRRRREAAQAAASQAARHQLPLPPPRPAVVAAVASPPSGGGGGGGGGAAKKAKKAKKAKNKSADSTETNGGKETVGSSRRGGSPTAASPPGGLARGSGSGSGGVPKTTAAGAGGSGAPRLSELQQRMRQKLEGAQFRMINEALYTSESKASLAKFKREPELFDVYHRGFREQVEKWPVHPLDIIIDWLGKYPKARVADFGCGEARLAATVPNKVHSFDLVSPNPRVMACDMANVPIKDASVHVAVFCLSLMGTNLADFLREAHRVLVPGGLVKVAEVRSRFEGEEGGVERFLEVTRRLGFDTRQMDRSNKMFLMAEFKKSKRKPEKGVDFEAKACIYKRR